MTERYELRFDCPRKLAELMMARIEALGLRKSDVFVDFCEEWLSETEKLVKVKRQERKARGRRPS